MPTLNWIGKEAVIKHHKDVPFRLLEHDVDLSHGQDDSGNIIVQGDNLHALKALLPRYAGQVKCIYIDPPYNTGNESWIYNDNVNSPEIRKWLGEVVGKEGEVLDRHDRWLCMMYPRLVLLKQFLRDDGAIFISIDDNEVATLRLLMDEVFGRENFIATIAWQKIYTIKNSAKYISEMHDYVIIYAKKRELWHRNLLPRSQSSENDYSNPDNDPRGVWTSNALQSRNYYSKGIYSITCPGGKIVSGPPKGTYWRMEEEKFWELDADNRVWWGKSKNNSPRIKKFLSEAKAGVVPSTWWLHQFAGTNSGAKTELREILSGESSELFNTPKPWQLIQRILQISTDKNSIILDSFSGSGATAHAILQQNVEDGGNRKFILVEMDENIAKNVTAERVKRICMGYNNAKGKSIPPLNGSFQYFRLSKDPLFLPDGPIRHDVTFNQLREFVWFMETGSGLTVSPLTKEQPATPFLGVHQEKAVFLLYNGILKDRSDIGGNVLNHRSLKFLDEITPPHFSGTRVVYGARSRFDKKKLNQLGITFHQLPYELAVKTWL
ncbi:site-specific DNA-methyltransferase [Pectobacterium aroidearum]|uniref:site-specific DNA-methyltransferase n=1 Tax=Pectobacterium aroidearum TaxID=1201031 RepID=UPI0032EC45EB